MGKNSQPPRAAGDKRRKLHSQVETGETRTADAVTVAWMLTALATFAAEAFALLGWAAVSIASRNGRDPGELVILPALLTFIALVTGLVCLLLIPITHRIRRVAPPRSVTLVAAVIGISPTVIVALMYLLKH